MPCANRPVVGSPFLANGRFETTRIPDFGVSNQIVDEGKGLLYSSLASSGLWFASMGGKLPTGFFRSVSAYGTNTQHTPEGITAQP